MDTFLANKRFWLISISILIVVSVLFIWGSLTEKTIESPSEDCWLSTESCTGKSDHRVYPIKISKTKPQYLENITVTLESNTPPKAKLVSIGMNMGTLPILFSPTKNRNEWTSEFVVPSCMHKKMEWGIEFEQAQIQIPKLATFIAYKP